MNIPLWAAREIQQLFLEVFSQVPYVPCDLEHRTWTMGSTE